MNNANNSQNSNSNNSQNAFIYPHTIFSFERKDYTIAELLTVFPADFLDLTYLHNVIPPVSPFAATRVSVPTSNLLINVILTSTDYKIYYCDNCPTLGQRLSSQLCHLNSNPTLTQAKQLNNPPPKRHHLISFIKNHKHKKQRNAHTQSLLLPNLQIDLVLLDTPPPL